MNCILFCLIHNYCYRQMLLCSVLNNFAAQYVKPVHFGSYVFFRYFWKILKPSWLYYLLTSSFFRKSGIWLYFESPVLNACTYSILEKIMTLHRLKSIQDKVNRFQLLQVSLCLAFCVGIHIMMKFLIFKPILFHRYLGTTPNASSLACLLYSICQQLSYTFMLPFEHIPNDIVPLTAHLKGC